MTPVSSDAIDASPEQQRWQADLRLRERELDIKERAAAQEAAQKTREFEAKLADQKWARWTNPLVLAVFAAALAALGNAWLAYVNGEAQRALELTRSQEQIKLEREKAEGQLRIENSKAEAARILEVIKTADPEKAAVNLAFLLDAGLIADDARKAALKTFLDNRKPGEGPSIPPTGAAATFSRPNYNLPIPPENPSQTKAATRLLGLAVAEINRNVDEEATAERVLQYWRAIPSINVTNTRMPWSGAFLSWLIRETGNNDNLAMAPANIAIWRDALAKKLTFIPNEKQALPGDIVIFLRASAENLEDVRAGKVLSVPSGAGIVYSSSPDKFSAIEGNVGNAIRLHEHLMTEKIVGFIRLSDR
ncbi:hypothetical protein V1277_004402 [Bradyrhizobium sp. AZCC 1588]|uniref:DUF2272 domain-containing protein n=1 Tax=Bradyrhizobium sp. AZCC 1588 TaxID=3117018 RepID=UPI002FEF46A3